MGLCINLLTHHICECNAGYFDSAGDGMGPCSDINECDSDKAFQETLMVSGASQTISAKPNDCDEDTTECFNLATDFKRKTHFIIFLDKWHTSEW